MNTQEALAIITAEALEVALAERSALLEACEAAEQTLRYLAEGLGRDHIGEIAENAAANLRTAIKEARA